MPIYARRPKSEFEPAPEGLWSGVCCDVVDKGIIPTEYGPKHKVQIRWLVAAQPPRKDGKPHMISKKYTLSLHEKSNLRQMLEVWRGRRFTEEELDNFDLEGLLHVPCQIQVAHQTSKSGDIYAFPQVVLKASKGQPEVRIPQDYVRAQDRPGYKQPEVAEIESDSEPDFNQEIQDDDIPF